MNAKHLYMAVIGLIMLVPGLITSRLGVHHVVDALASPTWTKTPAQIVEARLRDSGHSRRKRKSVRVVFEYKFDRRSHQADVIYPGDRKKGIREEKARAIIAPYPVGQRVTAYVNPADPQKAVLEPGLSTRNLGFLTIGGYFTIGGVALVFPLLKGHLARPSAEGTDRHAVS